VFWHISILTKMSDRSKYLKWVDKRVGKISGKFLVLGPFFVLGFSFLVLPVF